MHLKYEFTLCGYCDSCRCKGMTLEAWNRMKEEPDYIPDNYSFSTSCDTVIRIKHIYLCRECLLAGAYEKGPSCI